MFKNPRGLPWQSADLDSVLPAGGMGSILVGGTKILHALHGCGQKEKNQ